MKTEADKLSCSFLEGVPFAELFAWHSTFYNEGTTQGWNGLELSSEESTTFHMPLVWGADAPIDQPTHEHGELSPLSQDDLGRIAGFLAVSATSGLLYGL